MDQRRRTLEEVLAPLEKRFSGNIKCETCGNEDWKHFFYVSAGLHVMAACKHCMNVINTTMEVPDGPTD